jgi:hypothetical protein
MGERFCVRGKNAIAEKIEGEVIIIHLGTGAYYSLRDAGADVWTAIEHQGTRPEIVDWMETRYQGRRDDIDAYVGDLIDELYSEGLVERASINGVPAAPLAALTGEGERPFAPAPLEKHTDMQDLILIDPVHEVDARGWPHTAEAAESA